MTSFMIDDDSTTPGRQSGLRGQTVLVTRPAEQTSDLVGKIESLGARAIVHPVIEIWPPEAVEPLDSAFRTLSATDVIVFASRNGVKHFHRQCQKSNVRIPAKLVFTAIGRSTAELIHECFGVRALSPAQSNSQGLAEFLVDHFSDKQLLLVRGDRGSDVLELGLAAAGAKFDSVIAYRSVDVDEASAEVIELFEKNQIDWVTATSSSIGRASVRLFGKWLAVGNDDAKEACGKAKLVSISPTTSAAIRAVGGEPFAEAENYNLDGLVDAMVRSRGVSDDSKS
jgi:uroporphyrinogen III methyltransferase/synthase